MSAVQTKNSPGVTTGGQTTWDFHNDGDDVVIMLIMVVTTGGQTTYDFRDDGDDVVIMLMMVVTTGGQTTLTLHWAKME